MSEQLEAIRNPSCTSDAAPVDIKERVRLLRVANEDRLLRVANGDCDDIYDYLDSSSLPEAMRKSAHELIDELESAETTLQHFNLSQLHSMIQVCRRQYRKLEELDNGLAEHSEKLRRLLEEVEALGRNNSGSRQENLVKFLNDKHEYLLKELLGLTDMADKAEWEVPGSLFYADIKNFNGVDDWYWRWYQPQSWARVGPGAEMYGGWSQHLSWLLKHGWQDHVTGYMGILCSNLQEVEQFAHACRNQCSLGFRVALERYRPNSYSANLQEQRYLLTGAGQTRGGHFTSCKGGS
jgi:hypothetical protein